jgi:hypothetical protein
MSHGQTTKVSAVSLQYMGWSKDAAGNITNDAEDSRNPTWHLKFAITIDDNGREYKYQPIIKLQTSNEQAALRKAELILASLQSSLTDMAGKNEPPYPQLRWKTIDAAHHGKIALADYAGKTLPQPQPQSLADFVDDAVSLVKSDFHIQSAAQSVGEDGANHFSLSMHRGYGPEQDEKPYKDTKNQSLIRSFTAESPEIMAEFSEAVNTSFREAVTETYSTLHEKDGVVTLTHLQKFYDKTIENHFRDAIHDQLKNPRFADKVRQLQLAGGIARQERGSQRGA